jgi:hypothetical protein
LHPLVEYERGVVDERVEEDKSFHIFEMTTNTNVHYNGGKNMGACFL